MDVKGKIVKLSIWVSHFPGHFFFLSMYKNLVNKGVYRTLLDKNGFGRSLRLIIEGHRVSSLVRLSPSPPLHFHSHSHSFTECWTRD